MQPQAHTRTHIYKSSCTQTAASLFEDFEASQPKVKTFSEFEKFWC